MCITVEIWGPVGHHPPIPSTFVINEGGRLEWIRDRIKYVIKTAARTLDPFFRLAVAKSSKILAVNPGVGNVMSAPSNKVIHFPAVGAHPRKEDQSEKKKFILISAGRLVTMKGFETVLRAFANFANTLTAEERQNIALRIVGTGPLELKLKNLSKSLGVLNQVQFPGWIDHSQMVDEFNAASIFAFGSHEGAGMVVPEALSFGLPVICFDNDGPGFLMDPETGFRIPYSNSYTDCVNEFAARITELYRDKKLYNKMSRAAYACFNRRHAWNAKGEYLLKVYDEVLSTNPTRKTA